MASAQDTATHESTCPSSRILSAPAASLIALVSSERNRCRAGGKPSGTSRMLMQSGDSSDHVGRKGNVRVGPTRALSVWTTQITKPSSRRVLAMPSTYRHRRGQTLLSCTRIHFHSPCSSPASYHSRNTHAPANELLSWSRRSDLTPKGARER